MNITINDRVSTKPGVAPTRTDEPVQRIGVGFLHGELVGDAIYVGGLPYHEDDLVISRYCVPRPGELVQTADGEWHMVKEESSICSPTSLIWLSITRGGIVARHRPAVAKERAELMRARFRHARGYRDESESSAAQKDEEASLVSWWKRCGLKGTRG